MKLELFDNVTDFKPKGKVLDYWKFLPQTPLEQGVPSLFGNLKSMLIPNLMVFLLIACEAGLFYQLQEDGVGFIVLLALSIFDFVIGILPAIIFIYGNLILSVIKTNIFIAETKLKLRNPIPAHYNENLTAYHNDLKNDLKKYYGQKTTHTIIEIILALVVIGLAAWKFTSIYEVYGADIFVEPNGRFVMVVLILSVITHIAFTKTFFANIIFKMGLNAQKKQCLRGTNYNIISSERNQFAPIGFESKFNPVFAGEQFVAEKIETQERFDDNPEDRKSVV